ncbi:MAG: DUF3261 domain-containing protein [Polyangiales bacterium]
MRALAAWVLLTACATARPTPPRPQDPGALEDPARYEGSFMMRQRVEVALPTRTLRFEAVLQKQGAALTLVGLTPFGTRAFVLEQRGVEVSFTPTLPMELPFPARYMMIDIQRVFLRSAGRGAAADGVREASVAGEAVRETWANGRLMRRSFSRPGDPGGADAEYEGGMLGRAAPRVVRYRNRWGDYALTITTLAQQTLRE